MRAAGGGAAHGHSPSRASRGCGGQTTPIVKVVLKREDRLDADCAGCNLALRHDDLLQPEQARGQRDVYQSALDGINTKSPSARTATTAAFVTVTSAAGQHSSLPILTKSLSVIRFTSGGHRLMIECLEMLRIREAQCATTICAS